MKKTIKLLICIICILTICSTGELFALNKSVVPDAFELSYSRNEKLMRYDAETDTTEIIELSDIAYHNATDTYSALSEEDKNNSIIANNLALSKFGKQTISTNSVSSNEPYRVSPSDPNEYLYSGVVLVVVYGRDISDPSGTELVLQYGSGFMVSGKILVTAAHVIFPDSVPVGYEISSRYVYRDVEVEQLNQYDYSCLDDYPRQQIISMVWSSLYVDGDTTISYDWCIAELPTSFNNLYYFNCYTVDSTIINEPTWSVGYPTTDKFYMRQSDGSVTGYWPYIDQDVQNQLQVNNNIYPGMSGGPIYAHVGGRSCIAIIRARNSSIKGWGTLIYPLVLNSIYDAILNS